MFGLIEIYGLWFLVYALVCVFFLFLVTFFLELNQTFLVFRYISTSRILKVNFFSKNKKKIHKRQKNYVKKIIVLTFLYNFLSLVIFFSIYAKKIYFLNSTS